MERMYQRNKIQEESLPLKHTGELPIVGVNTFLNKEDRPRLYQARLSEVQGRKRIADRKICKHFINAMKNIRPTCFAKLKEVAVTGETFAALMETVKYCSLGQITHALLK